MKLFVAQIRPTVGALRANSDKIVDALEKAKNLGADFVITPELALTGYPPLDLLLLPEFLEDVENEIERLLPLTKGITLLLGAPRKSPSSKGKPLFNSCLILSDGAFIGAYDKRLLPTYDVFDEKRYFEEGSGPSLFHLKSYSIALTICEDIWAEKASPLYTNDPIAELIGKPIDLVINLSASPYHLQKGKERVAIGGRVAERLSAPLLLCNQVGGNDGLLFDGASYLVDAKGGLQALLPSFEEAGVLISLDEKGTIAPSLGREEELVEALAMGVRDYCWKLGFKKVLLGLSGGIDSAVVAAIARYALGKESVIGVLLPSRYSSEGSVADSEKLASNLGIQTLTLPIEGPHQAFLEVLERPFKGYTPDMTEENLQARIRGVLLMSLSNKWGALLLATSNKSELAMGYATLYGDMCGAFSVIGDLTKGEVYRLAHFFNRKEETIPAEIIDKAPSAELRPNQRDSDSLPSYDIVDRIVSAYIEEHLPKNLIAKRENVSPDVVDDLIRKIHRNEFKRRQAPLVLRVTSKSFSLGRYFPIVERWR